MNKKTNVKIARIKWCWSDHLMSQQSYYILLLTARRILMEVSYFHQKGRFSG